jgi:hypothetical protein
MSGDFLKPAAVQLHLFNTGISHKFKSAGSVMRGLIINFIHAPVPSGC